MLFKKIRSNNLSKVIESFLSLSIINLVNYVFPLIIIPILVSRVGVESFGKYIFAYSILGYINIFVQYGFNYSATSKVAKNQNDKYLISKTYTSIIFIRVFISSLLLLIIFIVNLFEKNISPLILLGFGVFFGQGLISVWLFQGLERMRLMAAVNLFVRVLTFLGIYFGVKADKDLNFLMLVQTISFIIGGIVSLFLVRFSLKIEIVGITFKDIKNELTEGKNLFLSTVGMNMYRESNILVLGLVAGYYYVGIYSPIEKLIKGLQSLINVIITALFPFFGKKISESRVEGLEYFKKIGNVLLVTFIFISCGVFFFSHDILIFYLKNFNQSSLIVLKILSTVIFFGGMNFFIGILGYVNFGYSNLFNRYVWISGVLGLVSTILLTYYFKEVGAAIAMCLSEMVLLFLLICNQNRFTKVRHL